MSMYTTPKKPRRRTQVVTPDELDEIRRRINEQGRRRGAPRRNTGGTPMRQGDIIYPVDLRLQRSRLRTREHDVESPRRIHRPPQIHRSPLDLAYGDGSYVPWQTRIEALPAPLELPWQNRPEPWTLPPREPTIVHNHVYPPMRMNRTQKRTKTPFALFPRKRPAFRRQKKVNPFYLKKRVRFSKRPVQRKYTAKRRRYKY